MAERLAGPEVKEIYFLAFKLSFQIAFDVFFFQVSGSVFVFSNGDTCFPEHIADGCVDEYVIPFIVKHNEAQDGDFFVFGKTILFEDID